MLSFIIKSPNSKYSSSKLNTILKSLNEKKLWLDSKETLVIENLRLISEYMIWGEKNNQRFFEMFIENKTLETIIYLIKRYKSGPVAIQALQTLSLLVQNIYNKESLYYLFSNGVFNELSEAYLDFNDEEVLAIYISMLKAISNKLNHDTVQFFIWSEEDDSSTIEKNKGSRMEKRFPLYMKACMFASWNERMTRISARTLLLNIIAIRDDAMVEEYLQTPIAYEFIERISKDILLECKILEEKIVDSTMDKDTVFNSLIEIEDTISYLNDIYDIASDDLSKIYAGVIWDNFIGPFFLSATNYMTRFTFKTIHTKGLKALKASDIDSFLNNIDKRFPDTFSFINSKSFIHLLTKTMNLTLEGSGLLVNRLILPKINEAFDLLEQGNHHPYEIDREFVIETKNNPIGPLALADMIGIDRCLFILNLLYKKIKHPKFIPNKLIIAYVKGNRLGISNGLGVYDYLSKKS